MNREIDKNIADIRQRIYFLLKNIKSFEFIRNNIKLKNRLKKEIISLVNSLLSTGIGTVSDVLFTEFMVK